MKVLRCLEHNKLMVTAVPETNGYYVALLRWGRVLSVAPRPSVCPSCASDFLETGKPRKVVI